MTQMNRDNPPAWVNPYTYKRLGLFGYTIYFEDVVLSWHFWKSDAESIVAMLNGAYNLGRSSMMFEL